MSGRRTGAAPSDAGASRPLALVREDLRDFAGYSSARTSAPGVPASIW